jgi:hypothetical protein
MDCIRVARHSRGGNPRDYGTVVLEVVAGLLDYMGCTARENKSGLAAMRRSRYQPDGSLDFAKTAAILACLPWLARINAASPREDGSPALVQFGAALGAAPSVSAESHAFARLVAFAEHGAVPSAVFERRCSFS